MNCEECLPLIEEYVDGELGDRVSEQIAAHLSTCQTCASEKAEFERECHEAIETRLNRPSSGFFVPSDIQNHRDVENRDLPVGGFLSNQY